MSEAPNDVLPPPALAVSAAPPEALQLPVEVARDRGRPLKFECVEDLELRINMYFDDCDKEYDNRKFTHGELYEEDGKKFCSECFGTGWCWIG